MNRGVIEGRGRGRPRGGAGRAGAPSGASAHFGASCGRLKWVPPHPLAEARPAPAPCYGLDREHPERATECAWRACCRCVGCGCMGSPSPAGIRLTRPSPFEPRPTPPAPTRSHEPYPRSPGSSAPASPVEPPPRRGTASTHAPPRRAPTAPGPSARAGGRAAPWAAGVGGALFQASNGRAEMGEAPEGAPARPAPQTRVPPALPHDHAPQAIAIEVRA
jgi:hypothetical protein